MMLNAAAVAVSISGLIFGLLVAALVVLVGRLLASAAHPAFWPISLIVAAIVFIAMAFSFPS